MKQQWFAKIFNFLERHHNFLHDKIFWHIFFHAFHAFPCISYVNSYAATIYFQSQK